MNTPSIKSPFRLSPSLILNHALGGKKLRPHSCTIFWLASFSISGIEPSCCGDIVPSPGGGCCCIGANNCPTNGTGLPLALNPSGNMLPVVHNGGMPLAIPDAVE
jgi:hypothetical protein